jgi:hypothetical protein
MEIGRRFTSLGHYFLREAYKRRSSLYSHSMVLGGFEEMS